MVENNLSIIERIESLCRKYNLCAELKEEITKITKDSYISGSNAAHEALCKAINKG